MPADAPFWKTKSLAEMTRGEWESLCDGCGRCCLNKLEDEDTGKFLYTRAACKLLDLKTCRCTDYPNRAARVPDCVTLTAENVGELGWLPATCAYRLLEEGKPLPWWHPLVSGRPETVAEAGIGIAGVAYSEDGLSVDDLVDHIWRLPKARRRVSPSPLAGEGGVNAPGEGILRHTPHPRLRRTFSRKRRRKSK